MNNRHSNLTVYKDAVCLGDFCDILGCERYADPRATQRYYQRWVSQSDKTQIYLSCAALVRECFDSAELSLVDAAISATCGHILGKEERRSVLSYVQEVLTWLIASLVFLYYAYLFFADFYSWIDSPTTHERHTRVPNPTSPTTAIKHDAVELQEVRTDQLLAANINTSAAMRLRRGQAADEQFN